MGYYCIFLLPQYIKFHITLYLCNNIYILELRKNPEERYFGFYNIVFCFQIFFQVTTKHRLHPKPIFIV